MEASSSASSSEWKPTVSQKEQWTTDAKIFSIYQMFSNIPSKSQSVMLELQRGNHIDYLIKGLRQLSPAFVVLDANRPWLCYWILHSIALLGDSVDVALEHSAIDFLSRCQDQHGGYGGGPGQMPHLATTYAAVNSLITLGGRRSLASINRSKIHSFLLKMKQTSGGFSALNILDEELVQGVGDYILSCQTYEGGIAGEPGSEAHGGYTFCGLATMILINEVYRLDLASLTDWLVFRQGWEGGFQGRTNKLVDGCYSFWQGGAAVLIQRLHAATSEGHHSVGSNECSTSSELSDDDENEDEGQHSDDDQVHSSSTPFNPIQRHTKAEPLFHSHALQQYILLCSQAEGGFRDKPGTSRDYYHTCYCLSGLATAQFSWSKDVDSPPSPCAVLGPYDNLLQPINPLYNIVVEQYNEAHEFFTNALHE